MRLPDFSKATRRLQRTVDQDGMNNSTLAPGDIKYLDQDGNGVLSANDRVYVKNSSLPSLNYGISLGASWKGIYMNAQFQGVSGYNQQINEPLHS